MQVCNLVCQWVEGGVSLAATRTRTRTCTRTCTCTDRCTYLYLRNPSSAFLRLVFRRRPPRTCSSPRQHSRIVSFVKTPTCQDMAYDRLISPACSRCSRMECRALLGCCLLWSVVGYSVVCMGGAVGRVERGCPCVLDVMRLAHYCFKVHPHHFHGKMKFCEQKCVNTASHMYMYLPVSRSWMFFLLANQLDY